MSFLCFCVASCNNNAIFVWFSLISLENLCFHLKSNEAHSCVTGFEKVLDLLLSNFGMNLMNSCMNSLKILAEEATFGVCVCVRVRVVLLLSYLHPIEVILPATIHSGAMSVHVTLAHTTLASRKFNNNQWYAPSIFYIGQTNQRLFTWVKEALLQIAFKCDMGRIFNNKTHAMGWLAFEFWQHFPW